MTQTLRKETAIVFDQNNPNWIRDETGNRLFIKCVMDHMRNMLQVRGHLFLNEILRQLGEPPTRFGQTNGWRRGDVVEFIIEERGNGVLRINFNVQGDILDVLP